MSLSTALYTLSVHKAHPEALHVVLQELCSNSPEAVFTNCMTWQSLNRSVGV